MPVWHSSIARLGNTAPIPTDRWGEGTRRDAVRRLMDALDGVGTGESISTQRKIAWHVRRSLSDAEIATLSAEWLAIPARNEFSEDGEVEAKL
jgi:hypothetical protein